MNKTAKEMFEELGFSYSKTYQSILYTNKKGLMVRFGIFSEGYTIGIPEKIIEITDDECYSLGVGSKVHNAIHQQMKELSFVHEECGKMAKYCPDLTAHKTVKAMLIGTGDFTQPVLHSCIKNKCVAHKDGKCMKYDNTVTTKKGNGENE
ncbi:hypothetical protein MKC54_05195 [[Clostridium] innocuum]|nr:hypothetical protein [[Clostridium] innocuum]MCR0576276.1 hypothetical protein [[Clostridium] innocuum]